MSRAIGCLVFLMLIVAVIFGYSVFRNWSCGLGYDGIEARYKFMVGCQIHTKDGWIPERRYRAVD